MKTYGSFSGHRNSFLIAGMIILVTFTVPEAWAQEPEKIVSEVEVKGNKTVSTLTILGKIQTQAGRPLSEQLLGEDLKRLYGLGYFQDVKIEQETVGNQVKIYFVVVEKPILDEIAISGNQEVKAKDIEKVLASHVGDFVDNQNIRNDVDAIRKLYDERGFYDVDVQSRLDVNPATNRASLALVVNEGSKIVIRKIIFEGLKAIKEGDVRKRIQTREAHWFRSGVLKENILELDVERIRAFYDEKGFSDVKAEHRLDPFGKKPGDRTLVFLIEEGRQYLVGEVRIEGNKVFGADEIIEKLEMKPGTPFSRRGLRTSVTNIQDLYFEKGYMNAKILFDSVYNEKTGLVDTKYTITENEVTLVNRVFIRGNTRTKDMVVRRELRAYPGEPFNGPALKKSKQRLFNLGYFEDIRFDIADTENPNKKDLVVTIRETKTGEFSFGGGFSSIDRLLGFAQVRQKNFDFAKWPTFTGAGQDLLLRLEISDIRTNGQLSWTDPWFAGYPFSLGFDVYKKEFDRTRRSGLFFDEERTGGALRLGKEFTDYDRAGASYRFETVEISDIPAEASADFRAEEGENDLSSVLLWYARDTRDNRFVPTEGYLLNASSEFFGGPFGGDKDFVKISGLGSTYFEHFDKLVLELKLRGGIADAFDDTKKVPIFERFYAGGARTIRGYRERRVGPRDPATRDPVGGDSFWIANAEYTFPLYEKLIKGAVFYDVGAVYETNEFKNGEVVHGTGAGIRVKTPIGPIELDLGYPLSDIEGEEKEVRFYFNISQGF